MILIMYFLTMVSQFNPRATASSTCYARRRNMSLYFGRRECQSRDTTNVNAIKIYADNKFQYTLAFHRRKMQEARYRRDLVSSVILVSASWLVTTVDTNPTPFNYWKGPPPLTPYLTRTRRTFSAGLSINYKRE